jgi:hypothetical protein
MYKTTNDVANKGQFKPTWILPANQKFDGRRVHVKLQ